MIVTKEAYPYMHAALGGVWVTKRSAAVPAEITVPDEYKEMVDSIEKIISTTGLNDAIDLADVGGSRQDEAVKRLGLPADFKIRELLHAVFASNK